MIDRRLADRRRSKLESRYMHIISGIFKGKVIKIPKDIRPTQNKVREALFDILGDIRGLSFLDLYAGSGAVGLEALSHTAGMTVFVERDRKYCLIIMESIEKLDIGSSVSLRASGIEHRVSVITMDALRAISLFSHERRKFDMVFFDPPYHRDLPSDYSGGLAKKTLKVLSRYDIVSHNGLVISQHSKKDLLPEMSGDLCLIKQAKYASTALSFYKKMCRKVS